jgi:nicotinamide riboside transporter PnuC
MNLLTMLMFTASMILFGWIMWNLINQREEKDTKLKKMLDDDDRRAAMGRGELPPDDQ